MVITRPIKLNVSGKLHTYSLKKTRSPQRPCLPYRIRNTHPRNYHNLKGKDIHVYFSFLSRWIILPWPDNSANSYAWHMKTLNSCFNLIRSHQQCIPWSPSLEIEPVITDCRAETLQLNQLSISHTSYAKLTSKNRCATN